jgi:hypothetical protein
MPSIPPDRDRLVRQLREHFKGSGWEVSESKDVDFLTRSPAARGEAMRSGSTHWDGNLHQSDLGARWIIDKIDLLDSL